jgi:hypothetical protein
MRLYVALALVAACGTEPTRSDPNPDAAVQGSSDGSVSTGGPDGGHTPTICEQAAQHSDLTFIQDNVFTVSCATEHCHASDSQAGGLVLSKGMARDELVNRSAELASGWTRVVPGDPAHSYLMVAIGGASGPLPNGVRMPAGAPMLCGEEIGAIGRWIGAGANP